MRIYEPLGLAHTYIWFESQFARMTWSQKIFFLIMNMALYTIYRGTPAPHQGPNCFHPSPHEPASLWASTLTGFNKWIEWLWPAWLNFVTRSRSNPCDDSLYGWEAQNKLGNVRLSHGATLVPQSFWPQPHRNWATILNVNLTFLNSLHFAILKFIVYATWLTARILNVVNNHLV